jgi:hypothetical protein
MIEACDLRTFHRGRRGREATTAQAVRGTDLRAARGAVAWPAGRSRREIA